MATPTTYRFDTAATLWPPGRRSLTQLAHNHLAQWVRPGDLVIDATIGNGHDTLFLAQIVQPGGRVIGFDVQLIALAQTRQRLESHGLGQTVMLYQQGHETLLERLVEQDIGQVAAVVFNLGYLPHGDKTITTQPETTRVAIKAAWHALCAGGLITLLVYVGHPGGSEELATVDACLHALVAAQGGRILRQTGRTPTSPVLLVAQRAGSRAPITL